MLCVPCLQVDRGVAIVRLPNHHAEVDETCGFCYFNNLAIAAKYAQQKHNAQKVHKCRTSAILKMYSGPSNVWNSWNFQNSRWKFEILTLLQIALYA